MQKQLFTIILLTLSSISFSQDTLKVSLYDVIKLAESLSLDVFKAKNMYIASYWKFHTFESKKRPTVDLNLRPIEFNRIMTKRYDFTQDVDVFREQKTMDSYANLSLNQYIPLTGGTIYLDTDLSRLVNYGDNEITTYSATLIRIGLNQPILAFNNQKWETKLAPLEFEKAKKKYIQALQTTKLNAINLFFELLLANVQTNIAKNNVITADTLYKIGKQKFEILAIQKEELLDLELSKFNSEIEWIRATQKLEKAQFNLNSFLGLENKQIIIPLNTIININLQINQEEAIRIALANNPKILTIKQKQIEANRDLDKAIKDNRFNANLALSFGLNQNAENIPNAYINPLDQQVVILGIKIPIIDWGNGKGQKIIAQKNKEIADIESKQQLNDFKHTILLKVLDFNLQPKIVESAKKARKLANESFELTKIRFMLGTGDVLKLTNSMKARQTAQENYITSIHFYWKYYFELQELTLYDFNTKENIKLVIKNQ